jgi:hypothetical protein
LGILSQMFEDWWKPLWFFSFINIHFARIEKFQKVTKYISYQEKCNLDINQTEFLKVVNNFVNSIKKETPYNNLSTTQNINGISSNIKSVIMSRNEKLNLT